MKLLYGLLVLCLAAIVVAVAATVGRLRWHLRRASKPPLHPLEEIQPHPEQQPVEK